MPTFQREDGVFGRNSHALCKLFVFDFHAGHRPVIAFTVVKLDALFEAQVFFSVSILMGVFFDDFFQNSSDLEF